MFKDCYLKKVFFKTFGCRTNQFDTQIMISQLNRYEIVDSEEDADIIVVNSCTVTNGADSGVRSYINQVERKKKDAKIFLTGCGVHTKGKELFKSNKVQGVFGHSEKENIVRFLKLDKPFYEIGNLEHIDSTIVEQFVGRSRAFIKIQEGCDFRCSYCIIPYVRGNARSLDESLILEQVKRLAENGFSEFILTGTNVGSYGKDKRSSIAKLLKRMSLIRGVRRIRIGSLEPIQVTDEFKELLSEPWMAKHLHIALQHTSDKMLKLMNRRNQFNSDLKLFEEIVNAGYAIGIDFIVGHPGEGEDEWSEAIKRIKLLPLTHIHIFNYSKRDKTPSSTMKEQVSKDVAKVRHKELKSIIESKNYAFRRSIEKPLEVLVESKKDNLYIGLDQYFNKILVKSNQNLKGKWLTLKTIEVKEEGNFAKL